MWHGNRRLAVTYKHTSALAPVNTESNCINQYESTKRRKMTVWEADRKRQKKLRQSCSVWFDGNECTCFSLRFRIDRLLVLKDHSGLFVCYSSVLFSVCIRNVMAAVVTDLFLLFLLLLLFCESVVCIYRVYVRWQRLLYFRNNSIPLH